MKHTALVTGGNRGIGLAIVKALTAQDDMMVLVGCRDLPDGEKQAKSIGNNVKAVELDLSDKAHLNKQAEAIRKEHGTVDILVNNAGVLHEGGSLSVDESLFAESLQVNAVGAYQLIRFFAPEMIEKGYGRIVNISSGWGSFTDGLSGPFAYSTSKALFNAITLAASHDLPDNVKMNAMCPGWVRTRMGGQAASRSPEEAAETALWLATLPDDGPSGGFFRDKQSIDW